MRILVLLTVLALVGCGSANQAGESMDPTMTTWGRSNAQPIMSPDGKKGWLIECSENIGVCVRRGNALCPNGFVMTDQANNGTSKNLIYNPALGGYQTMGNRSFAVVGYCS